MKLTKEETKKLADKIFSYSKADSVSVNISGGLKENIRFAVNNVTTCGSADSISIGISSNFGKKTGYINLTSINDADIKKAVEQSEEIARLSPENKEFMPLPEKNQIYPEVNQYFDSTAKASPSDRANTVSYVLLKSIERDLISAGYFETEDRFTSVANSNGLFAYHPFTELDFSFTSRTKDGTGSSKVHRNFADLNRLKIEELTKTCMDRAVLSQKPVELKPGKYTTILEKMATCDMVGNLFGYMNKRSADEGRSFFSDKDKGNKIGEKIVSEKVNIHSDPQNPIAPTTPFTGEGLPNLKTIWYENGILKNLHTNRFWAEKTNSPYTPYPANIIMQGSDKSLEDLIKSTDKGVFVVRLWYIRSVDPKKILLTGLSRDGIFYIENGEIKYPIKNFRFNESPANVLKNLTDMSREEKVIGAETESMKIIVPDIKVEEFNFSTLSDAI